MKPNIGAFDGAIRILSFILAIIYVVALGGHWAWLIPTGILFGTAILFWCPLYTILGIDTGGKG